MVWGTSVDTVNFKTHKKSYKSKKKIDNPKEDWVIFENTHEAIIDRDTYDTVQRIRSAKRRPTDMGEMSVFSGLLYCADCGKKMYLCRCTTMKQKEYFNCSTYRKKKKGLCTSHQITTEAVSEIVLQDLRRVFSLAIDDEDAFLATIRAKADKEQKKQLNAKKQELEDTRNRIRALDRIIQNLYEDKVCGNLTEERFVKMSQSYEREQKELEARANALAIEIDKAKETAENTARFIRALHRYTEIKELTPQIVREFIDRVIIHQAEKIDGRRKQQIEIIYNGIGAVPAIAEA